MNSRVTKNGPLTLIFNTLSQATLGNSSKGAPQVAPALLTRIWIFSSLDLISSANFLAPSSDERSDGIEIHSPALDNSAAAALQTSTLREEIYTFTPASTNPLAIINPIPREPPVTTATFPSTLKRSFIMYSLACRELTGQADPRIPLISMFDIIISISQSQSTFG